jgi:hypothetical protein
VFRAFTEKNFRERKSTPPHVVRFWAYLLRDDDAVDGLSVDITPQASVKHLDKNHGYAEILVGAITSLPDGLQVRIDTSDQEHAFICNLPLMSVSEEMRKEAVRIAKQLARRSTVIAINPI